MKPFVYRSACAGQASSIEIEFDINVNCVQMVQRSSWVPILLIVLRCVDEFVVSNTLQWVCD